jgi:hypothetical protein
MSWWQGGRRVTAYSPPMTGNRPELLGFYRRVDIANPVVTQRETGNNGDCQDPRIANPLVAGSSPARPTRKGLVRGCPNREVGWAMAVRPGVLRGRVGTSNSGVATRSLGAMGAPTLQPHNVVQLCANTI